MRYARRCKLRYEAVQIEVQAQVSDRVNQDPSDTHLPATAWPRQMFAAAEVTQYQLVALAHRLVAVTAARPQRAQPPTGDHSGFAVMCATQRPLPESGRGDYDPPFAGSNGGEDEGRLLALMQGPSRYNGWWYRLGCRVPTYESGVRGREPPDREITEQVISQGEG